MILFFSVRVSTLQLIRSTCYNFSPSLFSRGPGISSYFWDGRGERKDVPCSSVALICIAQVVAIMSEDTFCLLKSINK